MRAQNSDDVFYITYSKGKVWGLTIFLWLVACLPLFIILILTEPLWMEEKTIEPINTFALAICSIIFLSFAAPPFLVLTKLNKPITILSHNGFTNFKKSKAQSFSWSPNTVIVPGGKGVIALANIDTNQKRWSKLWRGPKSSVIITNIGVKQKYPEILEAINRLSPYPVRKISMWQAALE